jgi:hypothetical protein
MLILLVSLCYLACITKQQCFPHVPEILEYEKMHPPNNSQTADSKLLLYCNCGEGQSLGTEQAAGNHPSLQVK